MEDKDVIRVLAEFMGREVIEATNGKCFWFKEAIDDGLDVDTHPVSYLTDYNAIAEVWRKLDEGPHADIYMRVRGVLDDDEHWRSWYQSKPRDHAHALAKAISQSKGE